jgi:hypothetical protein
MSIVEIPAPKMPRLYPKQHQAIWCNARYTCIEATTKAGKTAGCLVWILTKAWNEGQENRHWWWVAPIVAQAKIAFRRMKRMLRQFDPHKLSWDANETDLRIDLKNGAAIWFKGSDKPDTLYGEDVYGAVIDEASRCFIAGTRVETPAGFRAIETLRPGDTIKNAAGFGRVEKLSVKNSQKIAVVKVKEYTLVSSVDHKYFTRRGWVEARHLDSSDQLVSQSEAVRLLQNGVRAA